MPILLADSTINFNSASWKVINAGTYRSSTAAQTVISTTLTTSTTNIPTATGSRCTRTTNYCTISSTS